jgi:hypothetical protein
VDLDITGSVVGRWKRTYRHLASGRPNLKSWTEDRDRCVQAGIGEHVEFATKPILAQHML